MQVRSPDAPPTAPPAMPVAEEARLVGLRGDASPTLEAVDRRRSQLWTVSFAGLVCLAASLAVLASGDAIDLGVAGTAPFRIGTVLLVVALGVYVMDKERHLRRLSQLLISERVATAAMTDRLRELESFHAAGAAMNSVLVIEEVLRVILDERVRAAPPAERLDHAARGRQHPRRRVHRRRPDRRPPCEDRGGSGRAGRAPTAADPRGREVARRAPAPDGERGVRPADPP